MEELFRSSDISNPSTGELPQLSIQASDGIRLEGDFGLTSFTFLGLRTGDVSQASSFSDTVVGSGLNPADAADFGGTFSSGTFTCLPSELGRTLIIPVTGDLTLEENEQFRVLISNPTNGEIVVANDFASGTILNDDIMFVRPGTETGVLSGETALQLDFSFPNPANKEIFLQLKQFE